jgi:hypothetical protein
VYRLYRANRQTTTSPNIVRRNMLFPPCCCFLETCIVQLVSCQPTRLLFATFLCFGDGWNGCTSHPPEHLPFVCPEFWHQIGLLALWVSILSLRKSAYQTFFLRETRQEILPHHQNLPLHVLLTHLTLSQPYRRCSVRTLSQIP